MKFFKYPLIASFRYWCTLMLFLSLSACGKDSDFITLNPEVKPEGVRYDVMQRPDMFLNPADEYIIVLGDVQEYTADKNKIEPLQHSLLWALSQKRSYSNIACVLEVGDVTNYNSGAQWKLYEETVRGIVRAGLPVFSSTGNHDYTMNDKHKILNRRSTRINEYLSYCFPDSVVKARFEEGRVENLIVKLPLRSADVDLILLEFAPRTEAVEWAREWVDSHSAQKFILMTHEMLWNDGALVTPGAAWCYAEKHFKDTESTWTSPKELVERLLKPYPNIKAVISGHNGFAVVNDENINCEGRKIPLIQFNLQYQENAGDSMVLLLRLTHGGTTADCTVYHTDGRREVETPISGYSFPL